MKLNIDVVKEPRGFIKLLQILLAVLAFSTTAGFSTYFSFHGIVDNCRAGQLGSPIKQSVSYPFNLAAVVASHQLCQDPAVSISVHFATDLSNDAGLFVAVGVLAMLYALAAAALYIVFSDIYEDIYHLPTVDFGVHVLFAVLWFTASCSWSAGVTVLKSACDASQAGADWCRHYTSSNVICVLKPGDSTGHFAGLNVSLIVGFLNTFVWTANLWFLYKETPFFSGSGLSRKRAANSSVNTNATAVSPSVTSSTISA